MLPMTVASPYIKSRARKKEGGIMGNQGEKADVIIFIEKDDEHYPLLKAEITVCKKRRTLWHQ